MKEFFAGLADRRSWAQISGGIRRLLVFSLKAHVDLLFRRLVGFKLHLLPRFVRNFTSVGFFTVFVAVNATVCFLGAISLASGSCRDEARGWRLKALSGSAAVLKLGLALLLCLRQRGCDGRTVSFGRARLLQVLAGLRSYGFAGSHFGVYPPFCCDCAPEGNAVQESPTTTFCSPERALGLHGGVIGAIFWKCAMLTAP